MPETCAGAVVAGAEVSGAPPTETGPIGFDCRASFLRLSAESRLRARPLPMDEVISGAIAFCKASTFTISVEICDDIFLMSDCSSDTLCLKPRSVVESC